MPIPPFFMYIMCILNLTGFGGKENKKKREKVSEHVLAVKIFNILLLKAIYVHTKKAYLIPQNFVIVCIFFLMLAVNHVNK